MTIEAIAKKYKLRLKKDDCGDQIIPGRLGHLYMYDEDVVGAMFIPDRLVKGWNTRRDQFVKAGATVVQNGETEGAVTFPAESAVGIKLSIKLLRIFKKKVMSPEDVAKKVEILKRARQGRSASPKD